MADSDMDYFSDLLGCDVTELKHIDDFRLQNEIARLSAEVKETFKCNKCDAKFSYAKTLNKHLKNSTCSKTNFICQNCGKVNKKEAFLASHTQRGKCIRPRTSRQPSENANSIKCGCGKSFSKRSNLTRHLKGCNSLKGYRVFECRLCAKQFSSARTLNLHLKTHKQSPPCSVERFFECGRCSKKFSSSATLKLHMKNHATSEATASGVLNGAERSNGGNGDNDNGGGDGGGSDDDDDDDGNVQTRRLLFQGSLVRYKLKAQQAEQQDLMYFFSNRRRQLRKNVLRELRRFRQLKWYVVVKIEMVRFNADGEVVDQGTPVFRSFTRQVLDPNVIDDQINEAYFKMLNSLDAFRQDGSGWNIKTVLYMEQTIAKYSPLRGSCTLYNLPEPLQRKRCLLNVTGPPELDGYCFKYAVLAGLYTGEGVIGQLPWSDLHQYRDVLKFDGVAGSGRYMPITSVGEFEKNNALSINIYGYEEGEVFPVYISKKYKRHKHINLLLLCPQGENDNGDDYTENEVENFQTIADHRRGHYCVIKNMSGLLASQVSETRHRVFICMHCLTTKHSAESLSEHERLCFQEEETEPVRCFMPSYEEKWLKFRNLGKRMKVSFVIVACFECYTVPLLSHEEPTYGYEVRERRLDPCAYSYVRISVDNSKPKEPVYYRGATPDDTMDHFLSAMASEEDEVFSIMSQTAPMIWCDESLANLEASNDICFV